MLNRLTIALAAFGALLLVAVIAYSAFFAIDGAPVEAFRNVSRAMAPALLANERFTISERLPLHLRRGLVVAHLFPPDPSKKFVKRIVGLPGDTLAMIDGALLVNDRRVAEPYAWHEKPHVDPVTNDFRWQRAFLVGPQARDTSKYAPSRNNWGPIVVPARNYFLLGDNRDNSFDSRYWGFLSANDIVGVARRIYFSSDSLGHVRWSRLGQRIE